MTLKIKVEHLYKIFGAHPEKALPLLKEGQNKDEIMEQTLMGVGVADASFYVAEGEILVVMGLSGSGKSTLLRCINRLVEPTAGKVIVDGEDVTDLSIDDLRKFRQKHLGMVFQNFALFPHRTVLGNVEYGLEIQGMPPDKRKKKGIQTLEQVGLSGWEDSLPSQLSGGMQQRVGLARALALDADILLMDEAFSALDPIIRKDMQSELLILHEKMKKTIILVSHDLDEAIRLGDRIILMKDGFIIQEGTAEDILSNPANDYVARFVEDVDMTKVLTAESVMIKPAEMAYYKTDGPRAALQKIKTAGISSIFVRKDGQLCGMVTAEMAANAIETGESTLEKIMTQDFNRTEPDTQVDELIPLLAESKYPVAVVDKDNRLIGVIIRSSLLGKLKKERSVTPIILIG